MIVDQRVTIAASMDRAWGFLMDVPAVSHCVPGVAAFEQIDEDDYSGALKVQVGQIRVRLEGRLVVTERNAEHHRAQLDIDAADRRIQGAVKAKTSIRLEAQGAAQTDLVIHADASIQGKLGEFGQAVMRRKADQIIGQFARNVSRELEATHSRD